MKIRVSKQTAETMRRVARELEKRPEFARKMNPKIYNELARLYGSNRTSVARILKNKSHKAD